MLASNVSEQSAQNTQNERKKKYLVLRFYTFVLLIGSLLYFGLMKICQNSNSYVFQQTFIEQDPRLSYPYVDNPHVPSALLPVFSGLLPLISLCIPHLLFTYHVGDYSTKRLTKIWTFVLLTCIGFIICLSLTSAITNTLKISFGEPRPSFFGICNYQGYRDALNSGNFTEYYNLTRFGQYGDIKYCRANQSDIYDAFMSFPSGHSSLMFAGVTYVSLFFFMFRKYSDTHYLLGVIVVGGYYVFATWVAFTRVMDYEHKTSDVFAGAFVGCVIAYMIYKYILDVLVAHDIMGKLGSSYQSVNENNIDDIIP